MKNPELSFLVEDQTGNEVKKHGWPSKKILAAFLAISEFFSSGAQVQQKDRIQTDPTEEVGQEISAKKMKKEKIEEIYRRIGLNMEQVKELGKTGKDLPVLIQAAAQLADVDPSVIIWVDNKKVFKKQFPDSAYLLTDNDERYVKAFCLGTQYPIFVNGTAKRNSVDADNFLSRKEALGLKYIYGATLIHEKKHAEGDYSESPAVQAELSFLRKNRIFLPPVYDTYVAVLEEILKSARQSEQALGKAGAHMVYTSKIVQK